MAVNMVRTSVLLPLVLAKAHDCPAMLAEQALRLAAIELSEISRAWRYVTTLEVADNTAQLVAPAHTAIHEIEFAEFNGQPLKPVQFSTIDNEREGKPKFISQSSPGEVILSPFQPGTLRVSVFLKPLATVAYGEDASDPLFDANNIIPDFYASLHGSLLAKGALGEVLATPDSPWTNKREAARYRGEFQLALQSQFRANMRGQQRAPIRTKFRDM
ncbi:hypothetical protein BMI86_10290 [Thioclava sp. DLFJ5-1]|uniref:hypothetical protein n=1 Tax=Thioclava sp. DLFJ5-1 TaxID=1915314 RepID=UPI000998374D|nr:hypothetical protein [Thioclava sp. DLFJ5-1]OOY20886.1 hypothetical protein BMI86_10290 [Thioclava sp. DLFJ5-1]